MDGLRDPAQGGTASRLKPLFCFEKGRFGFFISPKMGQILFLFCSNFANFASSQAPGRPPPAGAHRPAAGRSARCACVRTVTGRTLEGRVRCSLPYSATCTIGRPTARVRRPRVPTGSPRAPATVRPAFGWRWAVACVAARRCPPSTAAVARHRSSPLVAVRRPPPTPPNF